MNKILLLTDVPPCKNFSGGLLTDSLCRYISSDHVVCVVVRDKNLSYVKTSDDLGINTLYLTKPRENAVTLFKDKFKISSIINFFYELYSEFVVTKKLEKQIVQFGRQHAVDRVWCILQGQTTIRLSTKIAQKLKIPLLTQVWDHVSWWIGHNNINKVTANRIMKQYSSALCSSRCCGAASFVMSERNICNGIPSVPLISSLPSKFSKEPSYLLENKGVITIGFSGQMYAEAAFKCLLDSLNIMNWSLQNKQIRLRILGYNISIGGHVKYDIEFLGYRSQDETLVLLSECDLLFCPYITDSKYSYVAQTSFPAKLTTYLATGVPVLFCGPEGSSPSIFLKDNNAAFICSDVTIGKMKEALESIFLDKDNYKRVASNGISTFQSYLTNDVQKKLFLEFINTGNI